MSDMRRPGVVLADLVTALLLGVTILSSLLLGVTRLLVAWRRSALELELRMELQRLRDGVTLERTDDGGYEARLAVHDLVLALDSRAPGPVRPFAHTPIGGWRLRWERGSEVAVLRIESQGHLPPLSVGLFFSLAGDPVATGVRE